MRSGEIICGYHTAPTGLSGMLASIAQDCILGLCMSYYQDLIDG